MYLGAIDISPIVLTGGRTTADYVIGAPTPEPSLAKAKTGISAFFSQLPQLITAGLTITNAQRIANLNFERVKAGQPPLSQAAIAAVQPGVNIGLSPDIKNMLMIGGLGLGAILLLGVIPKRKKR